MSSSNTKTPTTSKGKEAEVSPFRAPVVASPLSSSPMPATILPYDPAHPYPVINPNSAYAVIGSSKNSGTVPSYSTLLSGSSSQTPVPPPIDSDWNVNVAGAGKTTTNGIYARIDADNWKNGQYYIKRVPYPDPQTLSLGIVQGSSVYYYANNVPLPWNAVWQVGSFGSAPPPTVTSVIPT